MDNLLDKTKQAVEKYNSKQAGDKVKATRTILSAVLACKNFITEAGDDDSGGTQQLARELSEVLSVLPMFANFAADKNALNNIHNKQLAGEHLDMIQRDLENNLKEMQVGKKKKIQDWVKSHPVLGKLKKSATKELPQGAYVLLFRRSANLPPKRKGGGRRDRPDSKISDNAIATLTILEQEQENSGQALAKEGLIANAGESSGNFDSTATMESGSQPELSEQMTARESALTEFAETTDHSSDIDSAHQDRTVQDATDHDAANHDAAEQHRPDQDAAEQNGPDQDAAEQNGPDLDVAEQDVAEQDVAEQDVAEQDVAEQDAADQDATEQDLTDQDASDQDQMDSDLTDSADTELLAESGDEDDSDLEIADEDEPNLLEATTEEPASETEEVGKSADAEQTGDINKNNSNAASGKPAVEKVPPDLVVRPAADGKVFTRFRPKEFSDDTRVYRMFRGGPPLVGACIIADGKLITSIGVLPQPAEGRDQLRLLLTISKEAVGKPGRDFVEGNEVLNELFQLCKRRSIHKDAYILLFQHQEEVTETTSVVAADGGNNLKANQGSSKASSATGETAPLSADATHLSEIQSQPESGEKEESAEISSNSGVDESAASTSQIENSPESKISADQNLPETLPEATSAKAVKSTLPPQLELVSKTTDDGRIITRYRSFDFSDMRSLYENFKKRPPVVGAAIIRERDLIKVLGTVPSKEGTKQLDVLLGVSRQALEKPAMEFITSNPVLNSLHELSNGDYRQKEYDVVLFHETDGKLSVFSMPDKRGKMMPKTPLAEFRIPKLLHDRFKSEKPVVGASVIGEQSVVVPNNRDMGHKSNKDKGSKQESNFRPRSGPPRSPIVLAAFGRTPLKQNVLLSVEILKRLGVDLSIL